MKRMSNIREYTKKKKARQEENFSQRILKHKLTIFYRSFLAIVLVAVIAIVFYVQIKNRVYQDYQVTGSVERKQIESANCVNSGGNILTYSKDGASCVDTKGNVLWDQPYEMQNPILAQNKDVAAIGDYNGRTIYIMNSLGKMGEIDTKMPIRNFCVSEKGIVAAVLDDSTVTWIYLFDTNGNALAYFKTSMRKSGYPIAVAISDNGELVGVSYFYVDSGKLMSKVGFYNFGPVGQNEIDNFVSGYDYSDSVVPFIRFFGNDTAAAVADNRLMLYSGKQKPTMAAEVLLDGEIQEVYFGEGMIGLLFLNTVDGDKYRLDIYDQTGKLLEKMNFDMEFSDILFLKEKVVVYNEKELLIHNVNGADIYNGAFKTPVVTLIPGSSASKYTLVTNDAIETIELK